MSDNTYFAAKEPDKAASDILGKADLWFNQLYSNNYLDKIRDMWMAYHGAYYGSAGGGHRVTFGGEQGELVNLSVNHFRNIGEHIITMITSNRPTFQARATNTDAKSMAQAKLANELLDYYMRENRMEVYLKRAVQYAVVLGSGYIKMEWNATSGEIYDFNDDTQTPIYEGDVEFCNLSPFDVICDPTKEVQDQIWVLTRSFKNKYDLAAKYPEYAEKIKGLSTKTDLYRFRLDNLAYEQTDDVPVYEFYHKRSESLPDGRYLMFLSSEIVPVDVPLPYRDLPVYRIAPSEILGTPYGYSPMFDLLQIQEAINSLYSTILTNQHAFGVQNVYIQRGADLSVKGLEGGLNVIEGNSKPESINLTETPKEVFDFLVKLEQAMETISGVNSVARGNPEASLKSGTALALVQSQALQYMSGLQEQYVRLIEDVGVGLINMLKDFAAVPRVAMIAGKANRTYVKTEFTGDDLAQVNRVIVDVGNALANTKSGKLQIAQDLLQYGSVSAEDYITVLNTGRLDAMTDDTQDELILIKSENEAMSDGTMVNALAIDEHVMHIKHHRSLLSDPAIRSNEEFSQTVLMHINQHIDLLRSVDPALLTVLGQQPIGPVGGSPPGVQPPPQGGMPQGSGPGGMLSQPQENMPGMPLMPQVPASALPNPELQQQAMGNVAQG